MRKIEGRSVYKEPWYDTYRSMMDRCYRETAKNYQYYGGRGIEVCDEWHDIINFEKWTLENGYKKGLSLERINANGNYCPENCKWATMKEQANNRRNTIYLDYNGETHSLSEWAELLDINQSTLRNRIFRGWPVEKALGRKNYYKPIEKETNNEVDRCQSI